MSKLYIGQIQNILMEALLACIFKILPHVQNKQKPVHLPISVVDEPFFFFLFLVSYVKLNTEIYLLFQRVEFVALRKVNGFLQNQRFLTLSSFISFVSYGSFMVFILRSTSHIVYMYSIWFHVFFIKNIFTQKIGNFW